MRFLLGVILVFVLLYKFQINVFRADTTVEWKVDCKKFARETFEIKFPSPQINIHAEEGDAVLDRILARFSNPSSSITEIRYYMHILNRGDIVSSNFRKSWIYEENYLRNLINAIEKERDKLGVSRSDVQIFDIGANIGTYGILLSVLGYSVTMFEPFWINQKSISLSLCMNELNAKLVPVALSN